MNPTDPTNPAPPDPTAPMPVQPDQTPPQPAQADLSSYLSTSNSTPAPAIETNPVEPSIPDNPQSAQPNPEPLTWPSTTTGTSESSMQTTTQPMVEPTPVETPPISIPPLADPDRIGADPEPPTSSSPFIQDLYGGSFTAQNQPEGEQAPTDLSHLIPTTENSPSTTAPPIYTPPFTQPETLVVPPNGNEEVAPNIPTNGGTQFPKWAIGVAAGLIVAVVGASAYFILGIGQNREKTTTSLPAVQQATQTLTTPPPPVNITPPVTTGSSSFGQFNNATPTQATSAADLLRQRQGR